MISRVAAIVGAHMENAASAVRKQDMERLVSCLAGAVELCETNPSQVHERTSQLRDLLVFIRSARSLCNTLQRPDDDLRGLEDRAEALRQPLH